jgi:predicted AAA+ superfamily ATPase
MELYDEIVGNAIQDKTNYVFLDEIQDIPEFEKCVIGLFEHRTLKFDIYISSSNSRMFSEELATLFTGRGKEIKILPLSFKQYYEYVNNISELDAFKRYMKYGGLPLIVEN